MLQGKKLMKKILKFCNDNHWYIIATAILLAVCFWTYGCQSKCDSMMNPEKQITRGELKNELDYYTGLARERAYTLDQQDAIKQQLLDAANVVGQGGTINASGILNLAASIGAISFGLNRNQKLKKITKTTETDTA